MLFGPAECVSNQQFIMILKEKGSFKLQKVTTQKWMKTDLNNILLVL